MTHALPEQAKITIRDDAEITRQTGEVAQCLLARGWTLATAESCTGGWIAKCCTDLAGSSDWFDGGFVTYSNEAKQEMLGVTAEDLETHGAVSETVVMHMAQGARQRTGANSALAVSGIAGPGGGTVDKPVGTVWFAWSVEGRDNCSRLMRFDGDRDSVRRQAVCHALQGLLSLLHQ